MKLSIRDFSCIIEADIEVKNFNVIIGPQASGKSLISKLIYFFNTINIDQIEIIKSTKNIESFSDELKEKFIKWFPITAWGDKKFIIKFELENYKISIFRVIYDGVIGNSLKIVFSKPIKQLHIAGVSLYKKILESYEEDFYEEDFYEKIKIERYVDKELTKIIRETTNGEHIDVLTYIPAGRSFFTNLGKALLAFEQTNLLDPISIEFGKLYTNFIQNFNNIQKRLSTGNAQFISEIIGGTLISEKGNFYILYEDGRKIPFSNLSSGQQELMPLLLVFGSIARANNTIPSRLIEKKNYLTFIEEPEAHLFPNAQSKIIEGLAIYVNGIQLNRKLIVTTHSPYVLSKINNLLKAGSLSRSAKMREKRDSVYSLIPRNKHINPKQFNAYALVDGKLISIVNDEGLVDGEYLDEISNEISNEFSSLINLEFDL